MTVRNAKFSLRFVACAILTAVALTSCGTSTRSSRSRTSMLPSARTVAQSVHATRLDRAQTLLNSPASRYMTRTALRALATLAGVTADNVDQRALSERGPTLGRNGLASSTSSGHGTANVLVNDPRRDTGQVDQTTQSETAIGVSGSHVVVGFNDSQQGLLLLTSGANLSGYAYSSNGGGSYVDGGTISNAPGFVNVGDPWVATDRTGAFYYSTLMVSESGLHVGVAKSTDAGKTFGAPVQVSPNAEFYSGDKPATTTGRDPSVASRDDVYTAWDDFVFDPTTFDLQTGLPVARSADGGRTFSVSYADRITNSGCAFSQYIGAQPLVNPANGVLRVFAERIDVDCSFNVKFSQWVFRSHDGGVTFTPGVKIADVTPVSVDGGLLVEPGKAIRTIEFPSVGSRPNGVLYVAWNDGGQGTSDIRLGRSTNGGLTWSTSFVTAGADEDLQPALTTDASGVHLAFYRLHASRFTVDALDSANGATFALSRVSGTSFPGVFNFPQFDPIIASAYMGDYIAVASDGTHRYFAWGDNRDFITTPLWPKGRNDPDIYAAHT
jgi:hypothetical protein